MDVRTFINRPILSGVISVAIVIVGLIGLSRLPVEQFPDIAPPTVRVSATYTGANAETVMKSVVTPLEEQLNGVENMIYMTSTATNTGAATINVYFRQGTDPDMSVVNVQNRVASAQGLLPAEVTKAGVTVRKRQNNSLKAISLYSPDDRYDANFLTNYMKINIEPRMSRIAGVGEVNIWGASYSLRIWLDPVEDGAVRTDALGHRRGAGRAECGVPDGDAGGRIGQYVSVCAEIPRPLRGGGRLREHGHTLAARRQRAEAERRGPH